VAFDLKFCPRELAVDAVSFDTVLADSTRVDSPPFLRRAGSVVLRPGLRPRVDVGGFFLY
jgi:hypothetical protein